MKNLLMTTIAATIITGSAIALPLEDIHVGAVYYHNAWNNNNKVQVLGIRGNSVKVQFLEGSNVGAIEFVPARDLMTPSQSSEEAWGDAGEAAAGVIILGCLIFGCEDGSSTTSTQTSSTKYDISLHNKCHKDVRIALSYYPFGSNSLKQVSWWTFDSGENSYLSSNGSRLKTGKSTLYYYAETTDKSLVWASDESGHPKINVDGTQRTMRKWVDKQGDTDMYLTCN